ncbi:MAG: glucose-1-phosphate thymidylyltransferase [Flavobacteriales bacterium]|nr:glucose-1-phosphate thymidylyltransferase [Flavobacteriales bacterium]
MANVILTDHQERDHLLPLTHTRPVAGIRMGLWTMAERWERCWACDVSFQTQDFLAKVFPVKRTEDNFYVNGALFPTASVVDQILGLKEGESLGSEGRWLATRSAEALTDVPNAGKEASGEIRIIQRPWHIFQWNGWAIEADMAWLRKNASSQDVPSGVTLIGDNIFLEEGAQIMPSIINTDEGAVYLGKDALIMEGSLVRGSLALMEHAQLKMGAKIYGPTTIGPHSKVGGEVNNCVIFGFSNKGHDGFIGNSVIGEWCNLGADTNTSNLKNNYADVKIYNYALGRSESTGGQFCGLIMGDHAKAGINTMFNTGTVCGVFANVFGGDFPHRKIPDFAWGGAAGFKAYRLKDALEVAEKVMSRRDIALTEEWIEVYTHINERYPFER